MRKNTIDWEICGDTISYGVRNPRVCYQSNLARKSSGSICSQNQSRKFPDFGQNIVVYNCEVLHLTDKTLDETK